MKTWRYKLHSTVRLQILLKIANTIIEIIKKDVKSTHTNEEKKIILKESNLIHRPLDELICNVEERLYLEASSQVMYAEMNTVIFRVKKLFLQGIGTISFDIFPTVNSTDKSLNNNINKQISSSSVGLKNNINVSLQITENTKTIGTSSTPSSNDDAKKENSNRREDTIFADFNCVDFLNYLTKIEVDKEKPKLKNTEITEVEKEKEKERENEKIREKESERIKAEMEEEEIVFLAKKPLMRRVIELCGDGTELITQIDENGISSTENDDICTDNILSLDALTETALDNKNISACKEINSFCSAISDFIGVNDIEKENEIVDVSNDLSNYSNKDGVNKNKNRNGNQDDNNDSGEKNVNKGTLNITEIASKVTGITPNNLNINDDGKTQVELEIDGEAQYDIISWRNFIFRGKGVSRNRAMKFRVNLRDEIAVVLRSLLITISHSTNLNTKIMTVEEICDLYGHHIHNLEYCLFHLAKSRREYCRLDTLQDRLLSLMVSIEEYLNRDCVSNDV